MRLDATTGTSSMSDALPRILLATAFARSISKPWMSPSFEPAERPIVGLDPDNQLAALLHLLEFVGIGLLTPEERER